MDKYKLQLIINHLAKIYFHFKLGKIQIKNDCFGSKLRLKCNNNKKK